MNVAAQSLLDGLKIETHRGSRAQSLLDGLKIETGGQCTVLLGRKKSLLDGLKIETRWNAGGNVDAEEPARRLEDRDPRARGEVLAAK